MGKNEISFVKISQKVAVSDNNDLLVSHTHTHTELTFNFVEILRLIAAQSPVRVSALSVSTAILWNV